MAVSLMALLVVRAMLARKLHKPTGRPVKVHGPTWGHSHAPRGITSAMILDKIAGQTKDTAYTVPTGR